MPGLRFATIAVQLLDYIPSSLHAAILDGTSTEDVSGYINNGLASARLLEMPSKGQLSIASSLIVYSNGGLIGQNYGCTIRALPNFGDRPMIRNATAAPATNGARDRAIILHQVKLNGNKAQNGTATEFSHGIQLQAVDGASLDIWVVDPRGDGLSIQQATNDLHHIGSSSISGKVRTEGCSRQGTTISCGEQVELDIRDSGTSFMSIDMEPDHPQNFIRNIYIKLLSLGTGNGSDISGGVCVAGDGLGCTPTNVIVDMNVLSSKGQGAIWRDARGLILRGTITSPALNGLLGIDGGAGGSMVSFQDVRVVSPGYSGFSSRETIGSIFDGSITVSNPGGMGFQIENARGGVLQISTSFGQQQGLYLNNTKDMTFPFANVVTHRGQGVWLRGGSSGNRFHALKSVGSQFGSGFLEDGGCNDNKVLAGRIFGNGNGTYSLSGTSSLVQLEPVPTATG